MFGVTIDNVLNQRSAKFWCRTMVATFSLVAKSTYYFSRGAMIRRWYPAGRELENTGRADNGGACGQAAWAVTYSEGGSTRNLQFAHPSGSGVAGSGWTYPAHRMLNLLPSGGRVVQPTDSVTDA